MPKIEYARTEVKTFSIAKGAVSIITPAIFGGVLPSDLVIFMLPTSTLNGAIKKDTYKFVHNNISSLEIIVDTEVTTKRSLAVDVANNKFLTAYTTLLGRLQEGNCTNFLTQEEFKKRSTFFYFDIVPFRASGTQYEPKYGQIKIDARFSAPTTDPLSVLVMGSFQSFITFNADKKVTVE